jgi:hypothetical protein
MSASFKVLEKNFSVVALGRFNVLHHIPENLVNMGLLNSEDLALTNVDYVSTSDIQLALPWGHLKVDPLSQDANRLSVLLRDYSAKVIFKDFVYSLLNYNDTSVPHGMGINHTIWIQHENRKDWDNFGHALTPKESWLELFGKNDSKAGMNEVSIKISSILQPTFKSEFDDPELNISLKPVKRIQLDDHIRDVDYCTECRLNYHFPLDEKNSILNAINTLDAYFDKLFDSGESEMTNLVRKFS